MSRGRQIARLKLQQLSENVRKNYLYEWDAKSLRFQAAKFPKISSRDLFANSWPLEVEIGPGTGEYLCNLASQRADVNFVGIEASKRAAYYATKLAAESGISNLRVIKANVKLLYPLIPSGAWSSVYVHFPDPAHKRKDEKHRVFDRAFLDVMARALPPGGEISVVSDKVDFFREMLELIEVDSRFERMHAEDYLDGFEPDAKSRFQLFWEGKGVKPRRFIFGKR